MSFIKRELTGPAPGDYVSDPMSHSAWHALPQRSRVLMEPEVLLPQQPINATRHPAHSTVEKRCSYNFPDSTDADRWNFNYCWGPSDVSDSESIAGRIATKSPGVERTSARPLECDIVLQTAQSRNAVASKKPAAGHIQSEPLARQDSAVACGPYLHAPVMPHGEAESRDKTFGANRLPKNQSPASNSVKRHATEMSQDVVDRLFSPRKNPRCDVQEGHRRAFSLDSRHFAKSGSGREIPTGNTDYRKLATSNSWPQKAGCDNSWRFPTIDETETTQRIASIACQPHLRAHTDAQHVSQMATVQGAPVPFVIGAKASPPDCQAWILDQPERCKDEDQDVPFDPPSTLYLPDSELECHESGESDTPCNGILSMRAYLAAKGSGPKYTTATWEDAADMLEELVRSDFPSSIRGRSFYLHQLIGLIPPAAKEAYQEVDLIAVDSWLFPYLIDDNDALELDALLEVLLLICMGLCDLGLTVFQLACFIASLVRSLAAISDNLRLPDAYTHAAPTPSSLWSSGNGSNLQEHAGNSNNNASSSQRPDEGDTGDRGTGGKPNGKRKFSGGQDRGDEHFEGNEPGPEGNAGEEFAGKLNVEIPCVHDSCTATYQYISGVIRCLKKHKIRVCPKCWCKFDDDESLQSHRYSQGIGTKQQTMTSICEENCVSLCDTNTDIETLRSAEAIRSQRHRLAKGCLKQKCPESRAAQWRYLYALTYPSCDDVPNLVLKRKKPKLKSIEEELAPTHLHSSPNSTTALRALQLEISALRLEREHFIVLLKMSSSLLAGDNSEFAMILKRSIDEKVSGHAGSNETRQIHGNDEFAAHLPAMPLTPSSYVPHGLQPSGGTGTSDPFPTQNIQSTASSSAFNRRPLTGSSMLESQPVQRMQAAAARYQQQVAPPIYGSQGVQVAMHPPQPQLFGGWLPSSNLTNYDARQFGSNEQGLTGYTQPWGQMPSQNRIEHMAYDRPQPDHRSQQQLNFDMDAQHGINMHSYPRSEPFNSGPSPLGHSNQQARVLDMGAQQGVQTQPLNLNNYPPFDGPGQTLPENQQLPYS
ncbi:unnamed protein product [Cercospora beticola]|nr:unnamed protein product [Cercospora beticola]